MQFRGIIFQISNENYMLRDIFMKNLVCLFLLILLSQTAFAQKPRPRVPRRAVTAPKVIRNEKEEYEKAIAQTDKAEKVNALQKFIADFPNSPDKHQALESLVSARAAFADEKIQNGLMDDAAAIFKLAVSDAPKPVSDKLFSEVLMQILNSLFLNKQPAAAVEIARLVEEKADGSAEQTLAIAGFYISLESASEAKRLAQKSLAIKPDLPAAYQTLGFANRLGFNLEESVNAYQKALELNPNSVVTKRSLAEMKRANGKPEEAAALFREVLANDETDSAARTGLILALFDTNDKAAESEMQKELERNPNNLALLTGAAYWYAAHNDGAKSVELAEKAVAVEPRYTWARIALGRGLLAQKRPLDAEKTLLAARQYGNFPTLEYELATMRLQSGFYREAAEGLANTFIIEDDVLETRLGGRITVDAKTFIELLSLERRASIFEPLAADSPENAEKLRSLLEFHLKLETAPNDETVIAKADEFVKGDDKMKTHRQLYAATRLLEKKSNLPKVLELTKAAVSGVDAALSAPNPASAVLADELYESRRLAMSRGELILVPNVARQTLSSILRGRIEDITGAALLQEDKYPDAVTRLKRAVSVLPEKSSWWRNSQWRLGTALEADGKYKDALDAYTKSYTNGEPNPFKYEAIEAVYQKVNGNLDGLEAKIGAKPAAISANVPAPTETPIAAVTAKVEPTPYILPTPKAVPTPEIVPAQSPVITEKSSPVSETKAESPIVQNEPPVKPETAPTPEVKASETPVVTEPAPTPGIKAAETKVESVKPEEAKPDEVKPTEPAPVKVKTAIESEPKTEATPERQQEPKVEPIEAAKSEPIEPEKEKSVTPATGQKPLFEPIIITVPKPEPITPKNSPEKNSPDDSSNQRPRIFVDKEAETPPPVCEIFSSQDQVSVINNGGTLALIIELTGEGSVKDIKAVSSSENDVTAVYDGEISGQLKRALFIIKSVSNNKGKYLISFEAACGKTEVLVKVR